MSGSKNGLPANLPSQTSWDPSTIANIIFGVIMILISGIMIWQSRHRRIVAVDEEQVVVISHAPILVASSTIRSEDDSFGNLRREPLPLTPHQLPKSRATRLPSTENAEANEVISLSHGPTTQDMVILSNRLATFSTADSIDFDTVRTSHDVESQEATNGVNIHDGVKQIDV